MSDKFNLGAWDVERIDNDTLSFSGRGKPAFTICEADLSALLFALACFSMSSQMQGIDDAEAMIKRISGEGS